MEKTRRLTEEIRKLTENRNTQLCMEYADDMKRNPQKKPTRVMQTLAEEFGLSVMGVRHILIKAGQYCTGNTAGQ